MTRTEDIMIHPASADPLILDGISLTCAQLVAAAHRARPITLAEGADLRIRQGRCVVEDIVSSGVKGYGITTGVGSQSVRKRNLQSRPKVCAIRSTSPRRPAHCDDSEH